VVKTVRGTVGHCIELGLRKQLVQIGENRHLRPGDGCHFLSLLAIYVAHGNDLGGVQLRKYAGLVRAHSASTD
jgi:hypothetical protein